MVKELNGLALGGFSQYIYRPASRVCFW